MDETPEDLAALQQVLDASAAASGDHLRSAFSQQNRPSAEELASALAGIIEVHFAVVTADGAPLVAPVDAIFFRGKVWIGLPPESVRARILGRGGDPPVSASYDTDAMSFIVHGTFREVPLGDPLRSAFDGVARRLYVERLGDWFDAWLDERIEQHGPGPTGCIEPRRFFAKR